MSDGPYRCFDVLRPHPYTSSARIPQRATALAAGALVLLCLAAPVIVCSMQPFSFYEALIAGLLAAETAVLFFLLWLAPALSCPDCGRPFLRDCARCRASCAERRRYRR
jgi:hypothetical protein